MNKNPYDAPTSEICESVEKKTNRIGKLGFVCSVSGLIGVFVLPSLGLHLGVNIVFNFLIAISLGSCAFGLLVSCIGVFFSPRRLAVWGIFAGLIGSSCINTFLMVYANSK